MAVSRGVQKDDKLYLSDTGHVDDEEKREETQCLARTDGITLEKLPTNLWSAQHIEDDIADFRDPKAFEYQGVITLSLLLKTPDDEVRFSYLHQVI